MLVLAIQIRLNGSTRVDFILNFCLAFVICFYTFYSGTNTETQLPMHGRPNKSLSTNVQNVFVLIARVSMVTKNTNIGRFM